MIIVADVKQARIPTVNMWCVRTTNVSNPIAIIAKIIPRFPKASFTSFVANNVRAYTKSW